MKLDRILSGHRILSSCSSVIWLTTRASTILKCGAGCQMNGLCQGSSILKSFETLLDSSSLSLPHQTLLPFKHTLSMDLQIHSTYSGSCNNLLLCPPPDPLYWLLSTFLSPSNSKLSLLGTQSFPVLPATNITPKPRNYTT